MNSLDLALVGNGTVGALIDAHGAVVWACFPRFDGDPMFCELLQGSRAATSGAWAIELLDVAHEAQAYLPNTPVLVTRLVDQHGGAVEITDFAPRFRQFDRVFCPVSLVRQIRRVAGTPRIRVRVRPTRDYGREPADVTWGSNHVRYIGADVTLRLTTDMSITALLEETAFFLDDTVTLVLGPDETVTAAIAETGRRFLEQTIAHWRDWVRGLAIPFEWQDEVIRSAITLRLNTSEDTGAIIAAMTTSIPEAPGTERTWDYRYCWLRDAYFVIDALNQLGATGIMERYIGYVTNIVAGAPAGVLQPVYSIGGRAVPEERIVTTLPGYRDMGPVRAGNQAHHQVQHDVYGSAILAATHMFFDQRLTRRGDVALFERLEPLGARAASLFDQPDAGIWELRGSSRPHTFSAMMCWAGCDRLARIAARLGLADRAAHWRRIAGDLRTVILDRTWDGDAGTFVSTMGGHALDASLLHMHAIGFVAADDPRFVGTVRAIERTLRRGSFLLRYDEQDDFGTMDNAFLVCTFWHVEALAAIGERDKARDLFETILACRNRHGLFAEDINPHTLEQWGNFAQTYSMVGLINSAIRLSQAWSDAL